MKFLNGFYGLYYNTQEYRGEVQPMIGLNPETTIWPEQTEPIWSDNFILRRSWKYKIIYF